MARKPFEAKHGQPGSTVDFDIDGTTHRGQVWSLAPKGVWAFHDNGLSGTTLVNVAVNGNGSPGTVLGAVTYGGFRRCDAEPLNGRCDFGNCRRVATHHFHNGPEIRAVCKHDGWLLTQLQPDSRLCEGIPVLDQLAIAA